jgi:hypothetical protein
MKAHGLTNVRIVGRKPYGDKEMLMLEDDAGMPPFDAPLILVDADGSLQFVDWPDQIR